MSAAAVVDDPVLRRLKAELQRAYGDRLDRVVLFGSRARGDHREDSDYDVAVFLTDLDDWPGEVRRLVDLSYGSLDDRAPLMSLKPFHKDAIHERTGFMREVRRDGIDL